MAKEVTLETIFSIYPVRQGISQYLSRTVLDDVCAESSIGYIMGYYFTIKDWRSSMHTANYAKGFSVSYRMETTLK